MVEVFFPYTSVMRSHQLMTACTQRNHQFQKRQMGNTQCHTDSSSSFSMALLTNTVAKAYAVLYLCICFRRHYLPLACVCVLFIAFNVAVHGLNNIQIVCQACVFFRNNKVSVTRVIHLPL